jgi:hypothetical protein
LELIPAKTIQLILGVPPYFQRSGKHAAQGIGDYPFLLIKRTPNNERHFSTYSGLSRTTRHGGCLLLVAITLQRL